MKNEKKFYKKEVKSTRNKNHLTQNKSKHLQKHVKFLPSPIVTISEWL